MGLISTLLLGQGADDVAQVQRVGRYGGLPATLWGLAGVNVHCLGDRVHGAFAEVSKGLPGVLLTDALLKGLALVSELDDGLGVGVDGGDRGAHAAGEGGPGHAGGRHRELRGFLFLGGFCIMKFKLNVKK